MSDFVTHIPKSRGADSRSGALQPNPRFQSQILTNLLNGIDRWIELTTTIDSLTVENDQAIVTMRQHLDRMALREDGKVHHVETWATQRETWKRTPDGWKLWRVDQVRDQRRLIDGKPQ